MTVTGTAAEVDAGRQRDRRRGRLQVVGAQNQPRKVDAVDPLSASMVAEAPPVACQSVRTSTSISA